MFSSIGYAICIPFAALVRLFYNLTGNYGVAIILFTLVIKLIMLPFQIKSKRSMMRMNRLSGRMQELQKKYANNQMKLQEEMQKLYAEEGVNPMSGCLWSFIPLPILIALYSIIRQPITHFMTIKSEVALELAQKAAAAGMDMTNILTTAKDGTQSFGAYGQISLARQISEKMPQLAEGIDGWINIDYSFLGLDMAVTPWDMVKNFSFSWMAIGLILIPILSGAFQFVMSWYTMRSQSSAQSNTSTKSMMYMMPLMSVYIAFIMPAALGVYWIAQSVFSLVQEVIMTKFFTKKIEAEEAARAEAIEKSRKERQEQARIQQQERLRQQEQKQTLKEKQKAAQEAKKVKKVATTEDGRVGERPYARGRSYKEDRYDNQ